MKKRTHDALDFVARLLSSRIVLRTPERHVVIRPASMALLDLSGNVISGTCDSVTITVHQDVSAHNLTHKARVGEVRQAIYGCGLTICLGKTNTYAAWRFRVVLPKDWQASLNAMRDEEFRFALGHGGMSRGEFEEA